METKHPYLRRDVIETEITEIPERVEVIVNNNKILLGQGEYHENYCG